MFIFVHFINLIVNLDQSLIFEPKKILWQISPKIQKIYHSYEKYLDMQIYILSCISMIKLVYNNDVKLNEESDRLKSQDG